MFFYHYCFYQECNFKYCLNFENGFAFYDIFQIDTQDLYDIEFLIFFKTINYGNQAKYVY